MASQVLSHEQSEIREGASTLLLLALLFLAASSSIAASGWINRGLDVPFWGALGGFAIGIPLARSRLRGASAHTLMLLLGVPAAFLLAMTLTPAQLYPPERLNILIASWREWLTQMATKNASHEIFPFVMQLIYLLWLLAYFAAWSIYRRRQVWGAILLPGAAIVVNLFQTGEPQTTLYLGGFVLCAFLLLIRFTLFSMEDAWRRTAIGYSADIGYDFFLYGAFFAALIIALAWALPPTAPGPTWLAFLQPLEEPWRDVETQLQRGFAGLNPVGRSVPNSNVGASIWMGGPIRLSQKPMFQVQSEAGRYWRAMVYDTYTGAGFANTRTESLPVSAGDTRFGAGDWLRKEITQTIQPVAPNLDILFAAAQPVRFDIPIQAQYARYDAPTDAVLDLASARPRRVLRAGIPYAVLSAISVADVESLRESTRTYPTWVAANYLGLPATLPQRVRDKAREITAPYDTPYDQATALETYLRDHIKYSETVAPPPRDRDAVDYLLFERSEGYCNYYASAMVVLARASNIPARLASGFARGEYRDGVYHVVEANSHAWPELYFVGYGWIEFEPTVAQPPIDRPRRDSPAGAEENPLDREFNRADRLGRSLEEELDPGNGEFDPFGFSQYDPVSAVLAGLGLLALVSAGALGWKQLRYQSRLARLAPAARAYAELVAWVEQIGVAEPQHATPFEIARTIAGTLPRAAGAVERIAALYVRERFGAYRLEARDLAALRDARRALRAAWFQRVGQRIAERIIAAINRVIERINELGERVEKRNPPSKFPFPNL